MTPDRASRVKSTAGNTPAIGQLTLARFREFYREPEAVFWVFIFPILLAAGCATTVRPQARPIDPVPVFLTDYGVHSSLMLPTADGNYVDGYYSASSRAETKLEGSTLTLSVKVYDQVATKVVTKSASFANCTRQ